MFIPFISAHVLEVQSLPLALPNSQAFWRQVLLRVLYHTRDVNCPTVFVSIFKFPDEKFCLRIHLLHIADGKSSQSEEFFLYALDGEGKILGDQLSPSRFKFDNQVHKYFFDGSEIKLVMELNTPLGPKMREDGDKIIIEDLSPKSKP
jgi:hypothetical protein